MAKETFERLEQSKKQKIIDASILEFSRTIPDHINIQNIIKDAKIPRGSFYQYFADKNDLYLYILNYIGLEKQKFFTGNQLNAELPFIDYLFEVYSLGYEFMLSNPLLYKAGKNMMSFEYFKQFEILQNAKSQVSSYYQSLIKRDQEQGKISKSIEPSILSDLALDFMDNHKLDDYYEAGITLNEFKIKLNKIMMILKKGIVNYV